MLGNGEQAGGFVETGGPRVPATNPSIHSSEWQRPLLRLMLRTTAARVKS